MSVNYTADQVNMMKAEYTSNPSRETVEQLADDPRFQSAIAAYIKSGGINL